MGLLVWLIEEGKKFEWFFVGVKIYLGDVFWKFII